MAKETDKKTQDLIKEVNKRKAEIAKLERPNYKTNCTFTYIEGNLTGLINIHVESDVKKLVSIAGFVLDQRESFRRAAEKLQIDRVPDFTWNGFSIEDWLNDIQTRINKIQISTKKKNLETLEERLNKIISPELRAEMELEAIAGELS